jgi:hypothetical protein
MKLQHIPVAHIFAEGSTGVFESGISRNHRPVLRITDVDGVLQTYRARGRKSVKPNRLPRNSHRRTGILNGQSVAPKPISWSMREDPEKYPEVMVFA